MQPKHQIAHAAIVHAENLNRENTVVAFMLIPPPRLAFFQTERHTKRIACYSLLSCLLYFA